jgi:dienelactone hydrolase
MRYNIHAKQFLFFCLILIDFNLKATDTVRVEKVVQKDWAAYVHFPPSQEKLPVIITLGGAEGGLSFTRNEADLMAKEGFIIMRLGYFKYTSATQGQILKEIRIEKVLEAIEFIKKSNLADSSRIGLLGVSKGAELALLVASVTSSVKAVAAHVPSHVVWYGMGKKRGLNKSSWTYQGLPMPFMPYAKPKSGWFTKRIAEFYEAGLEAYPEQIEAAVIRVEKISGPVFTDFRRQG